MPSSGIFELVAYSTLHAADVFAAVDTTDSTQSPQGSTKKITATAVFANAQPITIAAGTVVLSTPVFQATETWNASGVTFTAINLNVTDTASAAASLLANLQVGGASKWKVDKSGNTTTAGLATFNGGATVASGNFTVSSGTSSLQAVTATTVSATSITSSNGAAIGLFIAGNNSAGAAISSAMQYLTGTGKYAWQIGGQINAQNTFEITPSTVVGGTTFSSPVFTITQAGAATISGGLTVSAGGITSTVSSGVNLTLEKVTGASLEFTRSGTVNFALQALNGTDGVSFNGTASLTEYGRMIGGVFAWGTTDATNCSAGTISIGNATAPTGNPTGGGYLFVNGGALKYRGSSGTVTTIAPA